MNADEIRAVVAGVVDPEIPVLTIADLGVLRDVRVDDGGHVEVTVTPTYSGCPAVEVIRADIRAALAAHGHPDVAVRTVLAPAWTTDWMTDEGKRKLTEFGIAPPGPRPATGPVTGAGRCTASGRRPVFVSLAPPPPACPRCGSSRTRLRSRFSSTACTALYGCEDCREPFDHFKSL